MGCYSVSWRWLTSHWHNEPSSNSNASTIQQSLVADGRSPEIPKQSQRLQIPTNVTSCTGDITAAPNQAHEIPARTPPSSHQRTFSLTIPKRPALRTEEQTDVSQRSLRNWSRPERPVLSEIQGEYGPDASYTGVQFDEAPRGAAIKTFEEDADDSSNILEARLWDARIEWPLGGNRYFIPDNALLRLLTLDAISDELRRCQITLSEDHLHDLPQRIWKDACRLFAILVCLGMGHCIHSFLDEGLVDDDLPLIRADLRGKAHIVSFKLRSSRRPNTPIHCMAGWTRANITAFDRDQWWTLAPTFSKKSKVRHWALEDNCVLPFIEDYEQTRATQSGFSWVWPVRVHPAHHDFHRPHLQKQNPWLALKRLHSAEKKDFDVEVEMLKAFSNHQHPHLIKLLATFQQKKKYFLIFPYAKSNLREYWDVTACSEFSFERANWFLRQCKGIASGLSAVHNYRLTKDVSTDKPTLEDQSPGDNLTPNIMPGVVERQYGRHGDIKPENILWSDDDTTDEDGHSDPQGLLMIADFGLMEFHGKLTRSLVKPRNLRVSPTYEPPERLLDIAISRAYDIWSLGCVYLEFITWLIAGIDDLKHFPEIRGKTNASGVVSDDTFYSLTNDKPPRAIVRESVVEWIKDLHENPRCSVCIHDFLDLVSKDMLVVDSHKRIHCGPLTARLKEMLQRTETDQDYLMMPYPTPPRKRNPVAVAMTEKMSAAREQGSQSSSPVDRVVIFNRSERSTAANFGSPPLANSLSKRPFSPPPY